MSTERTKTEYTDITMLDGRVVKFPSKRNVLRDTLFNSETGQLAIRLDYRDGEFQLFIVPGTLPADATVLIAAAGAGLRDRFGAEQSGIEDLEEMREAAEAFAGQLAKNIWREGATESSGKGAHIVIRAVAEVTGKSRQEVRDYIDSLLARFAAEGKKVSRTRLYGEFEKAPKYAATVERMKAEQAARRKTAPEALSLGDLA